jgi:predicted dehydrogenase
MLEACRQAGVPLLIHENWRWQHPLRIFKQQLDAGRIGTPFRARIHYCSSFPVFNNQPFLRTLDQFILTDIGTHILDAARFMFGEAQTLYCQTHHVHRDLKGEEVRGEDVATTMITMESGLTLTCEMSYASRTEHERFPETYIFVEGSEGELKLEPDYWIRETTSAGTVSRRVVPPRYDWADPAYDLIHASMPACLSNLLEGLRGYNAAGDSKAETTGEDNLRTLQLVYGSYDSAETGQVVIPSSL